MSMQGLKILSVVLFAASGAFSAAAVLFLFLAIFRRRPGKDQPETVQEKAEEQQFTLEESVEYMASRNIIE